MRDYEVMLILPAEADESVVGGAVDRLSKVLAERGGEVRDIDRWGRRRFAFPIARQSEGYYAVVDFTVPTAFAGAWASAKCDTHASRIQANAPTTITRIFPAVGTYIY